MIDWTAVAGITGIITSLAAIIALILETKKARIVLQTEALLSLSERMDSQDMRRARQIAAARLLTSTTPNYEIADILDFFSTIAYLQEKGAIDKDLAFNQFSWWMIRYWRAAQDYVRARRQIDRQLWLTLERVVIDLQRREQKGGYVPDSYSAEMIRTFLQEEARGAASLAA